MTIISDRRFAGLGFCLTSLVVLMVSIAHAALIFRGKASGVDDGGATRPALMNLRCEYLDRPLGIDVRSPRLSWQIKDDGRGARQSAYQIQVATNDRMLSRGIADAWDTGKVASDQSVHVPYRGKELKSQTTYYWRVRIWDKDGKPTAFSENSYWEMGLLSPNDWKAKWIGLPIPREDQLTSLDGAQWIWTNSKVLARVGEPPWGELETSAPAATPAPFLRREFTIGKQISRGRVYVTALGSYRLNLNGMRVGNDLLTPEWTDYRKRIMYQTYDVTSLLKQGRNTVGVILGDGWYASGLGWNLQRHCFGPPPLRLLFQMRLDYVNGRTETIVSDATWKGTQDGPILRSEIYAGESYDARKKMLGWSESGFDDSQWKTVIELDRPAARIIAQRSPTVRITRVIRPRSIDSPSSGVYVFDMGQNMVGIARLKVNAPAGTIIRMRFAEILRLDGNIYRDNLRRAQATDTYICRGGGEELFEPHFTFHGFRYVEITGFPTRPTQDALTGLVFHSANPITGTIRTSSPIVNKLVENIMWGQRGNLISVPTDCPQRDERLGWMGDANVFWRTACFNMNMAPFTHKWMIDVVDAQSPQGGFSDVSPRIIDLADGAPGWGDAGIVLPWTVYLQYGDRRIIEDNWAAMEKWMEYLHEPNRDLIRTHRRNNDFGDWVPAESTTPKDLIATAYRAYDAQLMSQMAGAIGKSDDARRYAELFEGIKTAFNRKFVKANGEVGNGSQTCYALTLYMNLLPDDKREAAVQHLVADIEKRGNHLSTGFLGTEYLLPVLTDNGRNDVSYRLLLQETYPSWGYMIAKGATTIWERWNGDTGDPAMNSFNHYAFGSVGQWLYRYLAGIDTDPMHPGFRKILIRPHVGEGISHVKAEYESLYGPITVEWLLSRPDVLLHDKSVKNAYVFSLKTTIPPNASARVHVPVKNAALKARNRFMAPAELKENETIFDIGAGTWEFIGLLQ